MHPKELKRIFVEEGRSGEKAWNEVRDLCLQGWDITACIPFIESKIQKPAGFGEDDYVNTRTIGYEVILSNLIE